MSSYTDDSRPSNRIGHTACPSQSLTACEVRALIKYAAERGLDSDGVLIGALERMLQDQVEDSSALAPAGDLPPAVVVAYAKLSALTVPVSGRSLLETETRFKLAVLPLHLWTLLILAIVVANEILKVWFADLVEPEEGPLLRLIDLRHYVLDVCSPFLWGALGSCVWLLKRLSDLAENRSFDRALSHGWTSRILLGAILGGIVQYLYDPALFVAGTFKLGASALGFLTGVGVKVVYGAIEKSIEVLSNKMNLDANKTDNRDTTAVRDFLTSELGKTDRALKPEKHETLVALLAGLKADKRP